jgi:hypothetical protein
MLRIQETSLTQIHADPDPRHWFCTYQGVEKIGLNCTAQHCITHKVNVELLYLVD